MAGNLVLGKFTYFLRLRRAFGLLDEVILKTKYCYATALLPTATLLLPYHCPTTTLLPYCPTTAVLLPYYPATTTATAATAATTATTATAAYLYLFPYLFI
jgi:hypothetical protein